MRTEITLVAALALIAPGCGSDADGGDAAADEGAITADGGALDVPGGHAAADTALIGGRAADADNDAPSSATRLGVLTPAQLNEALAHKDFLLVDVRSVCPDRIPGLDACVSTKMDEVTAAIGPDLDRRVVLVCQRGQNSGLVGKALLEMGYRNVSQLEGGMSAWLDGGYPTHSDGGV